MTDNDTPMQSLVDVDRKLRWRAQKLLNESKIEANKQNQVANESRKQIRKERLEAARSHLAALRAGAPPKRMGSTIPHPDDYRVYEVRSDQRQNVMVQSRLFRPGAFFVAHPDEIPELHRPLVKIAK